MKKELEIKLFEKYPKIFKDLYGDMRSSAMYWGFDHNDGWFNIIDQLCNNIQNYIDENNQRRDRLLENNPFDLEIPKEMPQVIATQVKEKYGILHFYYINGDDYIDGMVSMAESISSIICEECGLPGTIRYDGWVRTLCDHHEKEYQANFLKKGLV